MNVKRAREKRVVFGSLDQHSSLNEARGVKGDGRE